MKASVVDLRHKMKEILAALDRGEEVTILYRGKERAVMIPAQQRDKKRTPAAEHPAVGMWKDREDMKDPAAWVRKIRRNRLDDF